jgi:hypothetical protein
MELVRWRHSRDTLQSADGSASAQPQLIDDVEQDRDKDREWDDDRELIDDRPGLQLGEPELLDHYSVERAAISDTFLSFAFWLARRWTVDRTAPYVFETGS